MRNIIPVFLLAISLIFYASLGYAQESANPEQTLEETPLKEDYSKKLILLPLAYYTPETKIAGGLLVIKNLWKEKEGHTSNVMATATATLNNQSSVSLAPRLYFDKGDWDVGGVLYYSYYPNRYYGRGVGNSLSTAEKYIENNFLFSVNTGKNIYSRLFVRASAGQDLRKIIDYEVGGLIQTETQNFAQNLQVLSSTLSLEWDERDYPQAPRQGAWYRMSQAFFEPKDRDGSKDLERFRKIDFDFRQYITLTPKWISALQLVTSEVQGQAPFQYLNSLGGGSRMRGYYAGQYRDSAIVMLQTEVRYEMNAKWSPTVFAGIARMASKIADLNSAANFHSGGFGVHYILDPENRTKLRLDVGFTGHETGAYFLIGEAF
jgi:hypothetical protein